MYFSSFRKKNISAIIKTDRKQHLAKNCVQVQLEVQGTIKSDVKSQETTLDAKRTKLLNFKYGCFSKENYSKLVFFVFVYSFLFALYLLLNVSVTGFNGQGRLQDKSNDGRYGIGHVHTAAQEGEVFAISGNHLDILITALL